MATRSGHNEASQGSVTKDSTTGLWTYTFRGPADPLTGRRHQYKKRGYPTRGEAQKALNRHRDEVDQGSLTSKSNADLTVGDLVGRWLEENRGIRTQNTYEHYEEVMNSHVLPYLRDVKVSALGDVMQRHYVRLMESGHHRRCNGCKRAECPNGKPLSRDTVSTAHRVLSAILSDYIPKVLKENPLTHVKVPQGSRAKVTPWTKEQAVTFLGKMQQDRLAAAWLMCLSIGMRRGEIAGLRWRDVNFERGTVSIENQRTVASTSREIIEKDPKGSSRRLVALSPGVVKGLLAHKAIQEAERAVVGYAEPVYVFVDEAGEPYKPTAIYNRFVLLCKEAGVPRVKLHALRHTAATLMFEAGVDVKVVQEILGHATSTITREIYTHYIESMGREAVNQMDGILGI